MDGFHDDDDKAKAELVRSNEMLTEVIGLLTPLHGLTPVTHSLASTVEGTVVSLYELVMSKYKK